jgi:ubiquitin-protein ligase
MSDNKNVNNCFLPASIKRLLKDVRDVYKEPLDSDGIFYKHDENNYNFGYALINGPRDSIYENGYYFFKFEFPEDYPHSPPKVTFHTNDGIVRFHPNFYRNGKVCLSLLNTWRGEGWTSCQSIRSVLLTLCSLLANDSLLNEPGITKHNKDFNTYNDIIQFKNFSVAIISMMHSNSGIYPSPTFDMFKDTVKKHFIDNYEKNLTLIDSLIKQQSNEKIKSLLTTSIYNMKITVDYRKIKRQINEIYLDIADNHVEQTTKSVKIKIRQNEKIEIKK